MDIVYSRLELIKRLDPEWDAGRSIGFVPTMGALHEGHLSLVRRSTEVQDITVVSIFVNPTQFAPGEDFEKYPRVLEQDIALLEPLEVDIVFVPSVQDIYGEDVKTSCSVVVPRLGTLLCGKSRPHFFDGVCSVVLRLFHSVRPDVAYFGEKDFQQLVIIKKMVRDFNIPVRIEGVSTLRDPDGLAMSSRNRYLDASGREVSLGLYQGLSQVKEAFDSGVYDLNRLYEIFYSVVQGFDTIQVDYVAIVDSGTLEEPESVASSGNRLCGAVYVGQTRLIDNLPL